MAEGSNAVREGLTCERCNRPRHGRPVFCNSCEVKLLTASVRIVHDNYGCDTGCCGHRILLLDAKGHEMADEFTFSHPYDLYKDIPGEDKEATRKRWIEEMAKETMRRYEVDVPIDYEDSEATIDC